MHTLSIIVIAISGRALAQSAAKIGCPVYVMDAFADRDTRQVSSAQCVGRDDAIALDPERLFAALDALNPPANETVLVIGSGLERSPKLLHRLAEYGRLCANAADIVTAFKQPELGAELLRAIGFSVPPTQIDRPDALRGWLRKDIGGAGGIHIRRASEAAASRATYYQREVPGVPMSVTFLADGERACVLGYNAQSFRAIGDAPFCYAGAAVSEVPANVAAHMELSLDRLVRVTGLRGLNGLDFMLDGSIATMLEMNPRPTATFELYEEDYAEGLAYWHIESFSRPLADFAVKLPSTFRAYEIIYAEHPVCIPEEAGFASSCRDIPNGGVTIRPREPVCSVFASARTQQEALRELAQRRHEIAHLLAGWQPHGVQHAERV